MKSHTIILSTAKVAIPHQLSIDFITSLINRGLTAIDYFGVEIDNPECYVEEDMKALSETITYFEFFFDTEESIDYDSLNENEVDQLLLDQIKKSANIEIKADEKDIIIYL
ncbi:hypothetical protein [Flavobacterium sp. F52]|uniref:hypothetical protein n=1 Tax=Flavobacterium sp. F52 TaxID=1202532 RepID=UPI000272DFC6|nr:hypothetical protein [Flavobacterium sp. F52]EJG02270.1 hypothetical protein FF52_06305 [Flavobacterium sp. F52]